MDDIYCITPHAAFLCISNLAVRFMNMTQLEKRPKGRREKIIANSFD